MPGCPAWPAGIQRIPPYPTAPRTSKQSGLASMAVRLATAR
jgi:hypothetical protein